MHSDHCPSTYFLHQSHRSVVATFFELCINAIVTMLDQQATAHVVFESPVQSSFLMPKGFNRNHNWSAFVPEVKRLDQTTKRQQTTVFCGL